MLVMVGSTRSRRLIARIRELGWGRVFCEKPTPYPGEPWVLDNGAFAAWKSGKPIASWDRFIGHAHRVAHLRPVFGVVPDVVAGGLRSLALSCLVRAELPREIPWYLAVQDGIEPHHVEEIDGASNFAGIFLGGTTAYKGRAFEWSRWAHERGLRFHYARVSTPMFYRRAFDCGADSCDSSQPLWSREGWVKFERAVLDTAAQLRLAGGVS